MNYSNQNELEQYLSMSLEDLKNELALVNPEINVDHIGGSGDNACDATDLLIACRINRIHAADVWWNFNLGFIFGLICIKANICTKISSKKLTTPVTIGLSIADEISDHYTNFSPFIIVALIIKFGIENFCGCNSKINEEWGYKVFQSASLNKRELDISIEYLMQSNPEEDVEKFHKLDKMLKRKEILSLVIGKLKTIKYERLLDRYIENMPKG